MELPAVALLREDVIHLCILIMSNIQLSALLSGVPEQILSICGFAFVWCWEFLRLWYWCIEHGSSVMAHSSPHGTLS